MLNRLTQAAAAAVMGVRDVLKRWLRLTLGALMGRSMIHRMPPRPTAFQIIAQRLRAFREAANLSATDVERRMLLGPGWIDRFEAGATVPALDMLFALLKQYGKSPAEMFAGLQAADLDDQVRRALFAEAAGNDLRIHFVYAKHDAVYTLPGATMAQFDSVIRELRDGLARIVQGAQADQDVSAIQTDSVAKMFLAAVRVWPHANPSDLWWFFVSRAYCDPFNHPAANARLDFGQSWKRTGGWALEEIVVRHYAPFLLQHGVRMFIANGPEKETLIRQFNVTTRLEADKVDVFLAGVNGNQRIPFGVVHVKASFAERRTDDVPMSHALVQAGYTSPLWTMDCKGGPSETPTNDGELGPARTAGVDRRSAKRKDIEDDGYFSACFSYNSRTVPTPDAPAPRARIVVCNFANPDDAFSRFIIHGWQTFSANRQR